MPTNDIYIINPSYMKENTIVDSNVDEKYLNIAIKEAQEIHIRKHLGTALYNDILNSIDTGSISAAYTTLLDNYILPALKYWAVYEAIPYLSVKITNKNILNKNSDNSTAVNGVDIEKFSTITKEKAEYYSERLILFLRANQITYPLINTPGSTVDTIYPDIDAFDSSIWFGQIFSVPNGVPINRDRSILYYNYNPNP